MVSDRKLKNYFKQAYVIAENSHDIHTKVGCLLINKNNQIVASGYNGFCRGVDDSSIPTTKPEKYDYIVHAEQNAIYQCSTLPTTTKDCIAVCTLSPCINCLRALWQVGITTIYFKDEYKDFKNQLNMLDLKIEVTPVGEFKQITLSPRV